MREGAPTLEQFDPTAWFALKIATAMTEAGLNLARLELSHADSWSSGVCDSEIHRKRGMTVCVHLNPSDTINFDVISAGALNLDSIEWLDLDCVGP